MHVDAHVPARTRAGAARRSATILLTLAVIAVVGLAAGGTASAAPPTGGTLTPNPIPVTDTTGAVEGVLDLQRFVVQDGVLQAVGTFTGTVGGTTGSQALTLPVASLQPAPGSCEILSLVLGPLDLNLLGLRVQLNQIELLITAEPGPGNLLGNLLCAIAGLLDGQAPAGGLAALLNRILGILG